MRIRGQEVINYAADQCVKRLPAWTQMKEKTGANLMKHGRHDTIRLTPEGS